MYRTITCYDKKHVLQNHLECEDFHYHRFSYSDGLYHMDHFRQTQWLDFSANKRQM